MTDLILLANLLDGPKHGYQLKKQAGLIFSHDVLHNNVVYPLLHRFEKKGWVSRKTVSGHRGQTRYQYALTRRGKEELIRQISEFPGDGRSSPEAFFLRVGLFSFLTPEVRRRILETREGELRTDARYFERLQTELQLEGYGAEVVNFLARSVRLELAWIRRLRSRESEVRGGQPRA